jgi:hypothetical protein
MQRNLNGWGGGRTSIAGEPFCPGEPKVEHALHGFRAAGNEALWERVFPWLERRSARPAFAEVGRRSVGSDSVTNRPSAPAEPEQEGRLGPGPQKETPGPPREPASHLLGVKQQEERGAARRRRSPGAASWWSRILDTVRGVDKGGNGQCGPHITRARSRCAPVCVLAGTADGLPGSAAFHRVVG